MPIAWLHEVADFHLTMFGAYDPRYDPAADGDPWGAFDTPYALRSALAAGVRRRWEANCAQPPPGTWLAEIPAALAEGLRDRDRLERELGAGGIAAVYLPAVIGPERFGSEIETTASLEP